MAVTLPAETAAELLRGASELSKMLSSSYACGNRKEVINPFIAIMRKVKACNEKQLLNVLQGLPNVFREHGASDLLKELIALVVCVCVCGGSVPIRHRSD